MESNSDIDGSENSFGDVVTDNVTLPSENYESIEKKNGEILQKSLSDDELVKAVATDLIAHSPAMTNDTSSGSTVIAECSVKDTSDCEIVEFAESNAADGHVSFEICCTEDDDDDDEGNDRNTLLSNCDIFHSSVNPDTADCSDGTHSDPVTASSSKNNFTDSSDIEVIAEEKYSSDSIEVLDTNPSQRNTAMMNNFARPDIAAGIQSLCLLDSDHRVSSSTNDSEEIAAANTASSALTDCRFQQYPFQLGHNGISIPRRQSKSDTAPSTAVAENPTLVDVANCHDVASRPDTLPLLGMRRQEQEEEATTSDDSDVQPVYDTPLHSHGTVTRDGDMIAFVAQGLNDMIKMSSPLTLYEDESPSNWSGDNTAMSTSVGSMTSSASGWSVSASSASGWSYSALSRSPSVLTQSPEDMPPIDAHMVHELETHAMRVACSLQRMMATLTDHLHKVSDLSCRCLEVYQTGVDNTCDCVDATIKAMYALMAKSEELSTTMLPVYKLYDQVKEINRLLDVFDMQLAKADK